MKTTTTIAILLVISMIGMGCTNNTAQSMEAGAAPQVSTADLNKGSAQSAQTNLADRQTISSNGALTPEEVSGLVFMREEEKLARDLYSAFHDLWGLPIFDNIASSEQMHMESVAILLEKYGVADPVGSNPAGVFTDPALQELFNQLLAQGSQSIGDALRTGAAVEEIDILDLQERAAQTGLTDILQVYENLEMGSRNHLRSFISVLQNQTGETYQPAYLTVEAFDQILPGSMETGGQGQPGGNGRGGPRK